MGVKSGWTMYWYGSIQCCSGIVGLDLAWYWYSIIRCSKGSVQFSAIRVQYSLV